MSLDGFDEKRRARYVRAYRLTDDEIQHIIAYNRRVLRHFTRSPFCCSCPPLVKPSTFADRFRTILKGVLDAVRSRD